jgi:hypothetical protein
MWRSLDEYRVGRSVWANRVDLGLAFADRPDLNWAPKNGYDHHCREPLGSGCARRGYGMDGGVMHLQFAPWRRLVAKQTWYQLMETLKYPDKSRAAIARMYSLSMDESGISVADAPANWWAPYQSLRQYINIDVAPWHEAECERLIAEHGLARFQGLNLGIYEQVAA